MFDQTSHTAGMSPLERLPNELLFRILDSAMVQNGKTSSGRRSWLMAENLPGKDSSGRKELPSLTSYQLAQMTSNRNLRCFRVFWYLVECMKWLFLISTEMWGSFKANLAGRDCMTIYSVPWAGRQIWDIWYDHLTFASTSFRWESRSCQKLCYFCLV